MNEDRIIIVFLSQELVLIGTHFNIFCIDVDQFNLIMICSGKSLYCNVTANNLELSKLGVPELSIASMEWNVCTFFLKL